MKKKITILLFTVALSIGIASTSSASLNLNLQLHVDAGRRIFTSTFLGFTSDPLGGFFGFIDLDSDSNYTFNKLNFYFEIQRDFHIGIFFKDPKVKSIAKIFNVHVEFNDGNFPGWGFDIAPTWVVGLRFKIPALITENIFLSVNTAVLFLGQMSYQTPETNYGIRWAVDWYFSFTVPFKSANPAPAVTETVAACQD